MSIIKEISLIIIAPIILSVLSNVIYDFFSPKFKSWNATQSVNYAKIEIEEIEERILEIGSYAESFEKTIRFAAQEILSACYSFSLVTIYIGVWMIASRLNFLSDDLEFAATVFTGGGVFRAGTIVIGRVLKSYRLVRDANNFEGFKERKMEQMKSFEAVIARIESTNK